MNDAVVRAAPGGGSLAVTVGGDRGLIAGDPEPGRGTSDAVVRALGAGDVTLIPWTPMSSIVGVGMYETGPPARDGHHSVGDQTIPQVVLDVADGAEPELVWRNELGGLTFRTGERFIKWNPRSSGIDLDRERVRLEWISTRHPAPKVLGAGSDDTAQWLVTAALPGVHAVGDAWRARRSEAIRAIATGLRAIHSIPVDDFPMQWVAKTWVGRTPTALGPRPKIDDPVVVHGDACAPNTLISEAGRWVGNVDFGDLSVGDRWADLAVASMSLDWNFGDGHQGEFFDAYRIDPDTERIRYYRELWHRES